MRSAPILFSAALASFALASPHGRGADHAGLAKRMENVASEHEIQKRGAYTNARFTWYPTDTGPDACTGKNHNDNDWFVALNMPLFGYSGTGNGHCGQQIRITAKGKTTVATIVDACATCPEDSQIDLTKGLFEFFDPNPDDGVFYGTWEFLDGSDNGGDDQPAPQSSSHSSTPKPTPTPTPTPVKIKTTTSTSTTHSTTSRPKPTPTTHSTTSTTKPTPTTHSTTSTTKSISTTRSTTSTTKSTSTTHSTSSTTHTTSSSSKTTSKSTSTTSTTHSTSTTSSTTSSTTTSTTSSTTSSTPTPTTTDVAGNAGSAPDVIGGISGNSDNSSATTKFAGGFVSLLAFIVVQVAVF